MMKDLPFTLATYHVTPGKEEEFVEQWQGLADLFASFDQPPFWGLLVQSRNRRHVFHSFGPWEKLEHIEAMRGSPAAADAFARLRELCDELSPDDYVVVRHVRVRAGGDV